jgi:hypothetical protein
MKLQHTPGPWNYKMDITEKGFDVSSEKEIIASRYPAGWSEYDKIEMEANARLIASAPKMLDHIIEDATDELSNDYWVHKPFSEWKCARSRLVKIIERATGLTIEEVLSGE